MSFQNDNDGNFSNCSLNFTNNPIQSENQKFTFSQNKTIFPDQRSWYYISLFSWTSFGRKKGKSNKILHAISAMEWKDKCDITKGYWFFLSQALFTFISNSQVHKI